MSGIDSSGTGRTTRPTALLWMLAFAGVAYAQARIQMRNWYNDPFFQISNAIPNCPQPAGPFITEAERRLQEHHRVESGTTCWLAGKCEKSNSYAYDRGIAAALQRLLAAHNPFPDSSLWVTVQGRVVFISGCVRDEVEAPKIEAYARGIPNVLLAVAAVYSNLDSRPPYRLLSGR
jgi:redox-sensitive bicupin YhaK (pirin superfamily)